MTKVKENPPTEPTPDTCATLPDFASRAGLPDDFDAEIGKQAARGPSQREHYKEATTDVGEKLRESVAKVLGRTVKTVLPVLGPDMHTGRLENGGAILFVDNVKGGTLSVALDNAVEGRQATFKPAKGRLILIPGPGSYTLGVADSLTRTAILFA